MKEKLLILLVGLILVWGCSETIVETDGRKFTIEYDHQESWTCFPWGLDRPQNAFDEANTVLDIIYDDITLTDSLVKYSQRFAYVKAHRQLDADSNGVYPGYLCGIKAFSEEDGTIIDTLAGRTWPAGPKQGWSLVCGWVAYSWNFRDATAIHELGHQRANLTHLCLDEFTMSPDHNAPNCVMGQGEVAICTGEDLTTHPEFCGYCCNRIEVVDW